jgi:DNA-binding NarL/FixJ family response regulator
MASRTSDRKAEQAARSGGQVARARQAEVQLRGGLDALVQSVAPWPCAMAARPAVSRGHRGIALLHKARQHQQHREGGGQQRDQQQAGANAHHLVLDLGIPGTTPAQLMQALVDVRCQARVIVCSGAAPAELEAALALARQLGLRAAGVLAKPFRLAELRALLAAAG